MRVILDTNLLISALITEGNSPYLLVQAWLEGRFELISSEAQLDEMTRVNRYPQVRKYIESAEAGWLINQLRNRARMVNKIPTVDGSRDPGDNFLLGMAQASKADYLATGDKRDVLSIGRWAGTRIVTASQLVKVLKLP